MMWPRRDWRSSRSRRQNQTNLMYNMERRFFIVHQKTFEGHSSFLLRTVTMCNMGQVDTSLHYHLYIPVFPCVYVCSLSCVSISDSISDSISGLFLQIFNLERININGDSQRSGNTVSAFLPIRRHRDHSYASAFLDSFWFQHPES